MARVRLCQVLDDSRVAELPSDTLRLYLHLLVLGERGSVNSDARFLRGAAFWATYSPTLGDVSRMLASLEAQGLVRLDGPRVHVVARGDRAGVSEPGSQGQGKGKNVSDPGLGAAHTRTNPDPDPGPDPDPDPDPERARIPSAEVEGVGDEAKPQWAGWPPGPGVAEWETLVATPEARASASPALGGSGGVGVWEALAASTAPQGVGEWEAYVASLEARASASPALGVVGDDADVDGWEAPVATSAVPRASASPALRPVGGAGVGEWEALATPPSLRLVGGERAILGMARRLVSDGGRQLASPSRVELAGGIIPAVGSSWSPEEIRAFEAVWYAYPNKAGADGAVRAWAQAVGRHGGPFGLLATRVLAHLERQILAPEWQAEGGRFIPTLAAYLARDTWKHAAPPVLTGPRGPAEGHLRRRQGRA